MAKEIKRRAGTTYEHLSFTGAAAEITIDTDKHTVVVHNGVTQGGYPLAREDLSNVNPGILASAIDLNVLGAATAEQGLLAESAIQPSSVGVITESMLAPSVADKLNYIPNNLTAITAPTINDDDIGSGNNGLYMKGSLWVDTITNKIYQCLDNTTTNAIWTLINLQISDLGTAAIANTTDFATATQGVLATTALQPGHNISLLTNDTNYITATTAPVQSVAGQTGIVTLANIATTGVWNDIDNRPADFPDLGSFSINDIDQPNPTLPINHDKFAVIIDHPDYAPEQIVVRSDGTNWRYVATIGPVVVI